MKMKWCEIRGSGSENRSGVGCRRRRRVDGIVNGRGSGMGRESESEGEGGSGGGIVNGRGSGNGMEGGEEWMILLMLGEWNGKGE